MFEYGINTAIEDFPILRSLANKQAEDISNYNFMWILKLPTKKAPLILNERHLNNFLASDIGTNAAVYWKLKNYF